jgi:hypothetical protein
MMLSKYYLSQTNSFNSQKKCIDWISILPGEKSNCFKEFNFTNALQSHGINGTKIIEAGGSSSPKKILKISSSHNFLFMLKDYNISSHVNDFVLCHEIINYRKNLYFSFKSNYLTNTQWNINLTTLNNALNDLSFKLEDYFDISESKEKLQNFDILFFKNYSVNGLILHGYDKYDLEKFLFYNSILNSLNSRDYKEFSYCHGDLNPSNILFFNEKLMFIDFEDVILAPKHYDLIYFVSFQNNFNLIRVLLEILSTYYQKKVVINLLVLIVLAKMFINLDLHYSEILQSKYFIKLDLLFNIIKSI